MANPAATDPKAARAALATQRPGGRRFHPWLGGRLLEWSFLTLLILILLAVFAYYARRVQGQGERAAVISTLGALRTALVIDHLQNFARLRVRDPGQKPKNPFLALEALPYNYAGEMSVLQALEAPAGSWVYDPQRGCIGYIPRDPSWAETALGAKMMWFQIQQGPGSRSLAALETYQWQGWRIR
jgi:hypothetical protein